ncbi:MAG: hypothetical protein R3C28_12840 [Pirellulaceae bacterium]
MTYYWYRFVDQPALLNADLSAEERAATAGSSRTAASALEEGIKTTYRRRESERQGRIRPGPDCYPPEGYEIGYVPIVTKQEPNVQPDANDAEKYSVTSPPAEMNLDPFYQKYVDASGYPVVSSAAVNDYALKEAASFLIDMLLAQRPDVQQ